MVSPESRFFYTVVAGVTERRVPVRPPEEMLCFLGAMLAKTRRPECAGSLSNMP